jgi:hypothetical protein
LERAGLPAPADETYPDEPIKAYKKMLKKTVTFLNYSFISLISPQTLQTFFKLGSKLSHPLTQQRFLERAGLPAPADETYPDEPITAYKNTLKKTVIVHHKDFKTRQFLEKDGKVLRFFCVWDDRGSVYGERRPYVSSLSAFNRGR